MKAVYFPEILVPMYQITQCHIPEDHTLEILTLYLTSNTTGLTKQNSLLKEACFSEVYKMQNLISFLKKHMPQLSHFPGETDACYSMYSVPPYKFFEMVARVPSQSS